MLVSEAMFLTVFFHGIFSYIYLESKNISKKMVRNTYFLRYQLLNQVIGVIHASILNFVLIWFPVSSSLKIPESFKAPKETQLRTLTISNTCVLSGINRAMLGLPVNIPAMHFTPSGHFMGSHPFLSHYPFLSLCMLCH